MPDPHATQDRAAINDALDALEAMCLQYLSAVEEDGVLYHSFMSAGEFACAVLARQRPERWVETAAGIAIKGEQLVTYWPEGDS